MRPRAAALLPLAALALAGCGEDLCVPPAGSEQTLFVRPPGDAAGGTDLHRFETIQAALDAVDASVPTTVCVASGVYREELRVGPNTTLLGAGRDLVRVRPPQARRDVEPATVDRSLLQARPTTEGPVLISGLDLGGAAICAEALGPGTTTLQDLRIAGCALGLRASGGDITLQRAAVKANTVQGILLQSLHAAILRDVELVENGSGPGVDFGGRSPALVLGGLDRGAGLRTEGVDDLLVEGLLVQGSDWDGAQIVLGAGDFDLRSLSAELSGLAADGIGPLLSVRGGTGSVDGVVLHGQGHGAVELLEGSLELEDLAWTDTLPPDDPDVPGARPPVLVLDGGSLGLRHASVAATAASVGIQAGPEAALAVQNSVFWGFGGGNVLRGAAVAPSFSHVHSDDPSLDGEAMTTAGDPAWTGRTLAPASDSPLRCAGVDLGPGADLLGHDRPFAPGKAPDLGAVELQEACP